MLDKSLPWTSSITTWGWNHLPWWHFLTRNQTLIHFGTRTWRFGVSTSSASKSQAIHMQGTHTSEKQWDIQTSSFFPMTYSCTNTHTMTDSTQVVTKRQLKAICENGFAKIDLAPFNRGWFLDPFWFIKTSIKPREHVLAKCDGDYHPNKQGPLNF